MPNNRPRKPGRPLGRTNPDYAQSRARLVHAIWPMLLRPGGARMSFREMARCADVSPATLQHYFGDRRGVLRAALQALHESGGRHLTEAAAADHGAAREALAWLLAEVAKGWPRGLSAAHVIGLTAGLADEELGPAYVAEILEPTLQAVEGRIARHVAQGELEACDLRQAALELLAPALLALLHQESLLGARYRPLDLPKFLAEHVDRFLRAYGARPRPGARRPRDPG